MFICEKCGSSRPPKEKQTRIIVAQRLKEYFNYTKDGLKRTEGIEISKELKIGECCK